MNVRYPKRGKYKLSKHRFYMVYHYALQYREWKDEYKSLDGLKAMSIDGMPHGTTTGNPTESIGIKRDELMRKMKLIEDTVRETDENLYTWLLKAVTNEGTTYAYLSGIMSIPVSHTTYYDKRKEFYYNLSKKLENL